MIDRAELKRLAEAFPADLDWDSNTEPFFNGPSGESLGGGSTGFYCVYGADFEIDGEQYDGHTYVETCKVDFAKFMVAARDGVLALIAENEALREANDKLSRRNGMLEENVKVLTDTHVLYTWLRKKCDQPSNDVVAVNMNIGHDWVPVHDLDRDLWAMINREEP
jgi:hypothetical protein